MPLAGASGSGELAPAVRAREGKPESDRESIWVLIWHVFTGLGHETPAPWEGLERMTGAEPAKLLIRRSLDLPW